MYIGLPQVQTDSIHRHLETQQQDINEDMKLVFNDAKDFARSVIIDKQLPEFNHKRTLGKLTFRTQFFFLNFLAGLYRDVDFSSSTKQTHFIEETLRSKFESYYKANIDDWNSIKNSKE